MFQAFLRSLGIDPVTRNDAAHALCNRLTAFPGAPNPTPVVVTHAQCINNNGDVRLFTDDRKQFLVTITEIKA